MNVTYSWMSSILPTAPPAAAPRVAQPAQRHGTTLAPGDAQAGFHRARSRLARRADGDRPRRVAGSPDEYEPAGARTGRRRAGRVAGVAGQACRGSGEGGAGPIGTHPPSRGSRAG